MAKKSKKRVNESVREQKPEPVEAEIVHVDTDHGVRSSVVRNIVIVILVLVGLYFLMNFISGDDADSDKKTGDETSQVEDGDTTKEDEKKSDDTPSNLPADTTVKETDKAFSYTVGEGESYTTVARRAVASSDSALTPAERVAAETKITTDANAELLAVGQDVELSKDTVRAAVEWAKGLSAEEKAAWQPYADLVAW